MRQLYPALNFPRVRGALSNPLSPLRVPTPLENSKSAIRPVPWENAKYIASKRFIYQKTFDMLYLIK